MGRMDTCICMTESLPCSPEAMATLLISYAPTQIKSLKGRAAPFSSLSSCSCIHSCIIHALTNSCSFRWVKICCPHFFFYPHAQIWPLEAFSHGDFSVLWTSFRHSLSMCLLSGITRHSKLIHCVPSLGQPWSQPFLLGALALFAGRIRIYF